MMFELDILQIHITRNGFHFGERLFIHCLNGHWLGVGLKMSGTVADCKYVPSLVDSEPISIVILIVIKNRIQV